MSARRNKKEKLPVTPTLDLQAFRKLNEPSSPPLDELGAALAGRLGKGDDPYAPLPAPEADASSSAGELAAALLASQTSESTEASADCPISPRTIFEAMLFVGGPENKPLTSRQVADLMRGVRPAEIDALVAELNADYAKRNCPYEIASEGAGYRLKLRDAFDAVREQLFGSTRQAKLSRAAIEVLAAAAYRPGITADEINRLRGVPSAPILLQLVRRQLLKPERSGERSQRVVHYHVTPRFLKLFDLASLDELPQSDDLEAR